MQEKGNLKRDLLVVSIVIACFICIFIADYYRGVQVSKSKKEVVCGKVIVDTYQKVFKSDRHPLIRFIQVQINQQQTKDFLIDSDKVMFDKLVCVEYSTEHVYSNYSLYTRSFPAVTNVYYQ